MNGSSSPDDSGRQMLLHADDIDPSHGSFYMDSPSFNDKEPGVQITSSPESMADVIKAHTSIHINPEWRFESF